MAIVGRFEGAFIMSREQVLGTNTYPAPEVITMPDLAKIEEIISVSITGGFVAIGDSFTGNVVDVDVFGQDASPSDDAPLRELGAVDLSGQTITVVCVGT